MDQPGDDKPDDDLQADEKPKPAARPKARAGQADAEAEQAMPNSPAVMAVLESHPTTPAELLRAINILADLNHPELAIPLVDELAHKKLDITAKAALANQFNSATLIKLARDPQLAAAMGPLVDDLLKSAEAFRRDPKRLAAWARQLSDPRETVRAAGTVALLRAREAAVAPLVDVLADSQRLAEHRAAQEILVELDELAVGPLLGVLESPDAALKARVIEVLGQIRAPQAVAQLLGPLLSPSSPAPLRAAAAAALESISGHVPNPPDALRLLEHAAGRGWSSRDATMKAARRRPNCGIGMPSENKVCPSSTTRLALRWPWPRGWREISINSTHITLRIAGCI